MNTVNITILDSYKNRLTSISNISYLTFYEEWNLSRHPLFINFGAPSSNRNCDTIVPR